MKVRNIRLRNANMRDGYMSQFIQIPMLGSLNGEETIQMWEDRASQQAIARFFKSRAMIRTSIVQACDDALAPTIPNGAWLGVDRTVKAFQGNAYYCTDNLPQYAKDTEPNGSSIARIEKTLEGYTYYYDEAEPVKLKDLSEVKIRGRIEVICINNWLDPKASVL